MTTTYELYTNENGTPKLVEGKAPAIIERVETLEETLDKGVVTSVNGNTGDIIPEQTGCLPLIGGKMMGSIQSELGQGAPVVTNTSGGQLWFFDVSDTTYKGGFLLRARSSTDEAAKDLCGQSDGVLLWDGKHVFREMQSVESSGDGYALQCFRLSNSVQIIFGHVTSGTIVTFPLPFKLAPSMQLTHYSSDGAYSQITSVVQAIDGASMVARTYNTSGHLVTTQVGIFAIGHWA